MSLGAPIVDVTMKVQSSSATGKATDKQEPLSIVKDGVVTAAGYDPIDVNASSVGLIILLVLGILLLIGIIVVVLHHIRKVRREVQEAQNLDKITKKGMDNKEDTDA